MYRFFSVVCAIIFLLPGATVSAGELQETHGLSSGKLVRELAKRSRNGYRLIDIDGFNVNGKVYFSTRWEKDSSVKWIAKHDLAASGVKEETDRLRKDGYRITDISGYKSGDGAKFVITAQQSSGSETEVRHDLSSDELLAEHGKLTGKGYRLVQISSYNMRGKILHASIWEKKAGPEQIIRAALNADDLKKETTKLEGEGYQPALIDGYSVDGKDFYTIALEKQKTEMRVLTTQLNSVNYQSELENKYYSGYSLKAATGYAIGKRPHYAAIWEGGRFRPDELKHIDKSVQALLDKYNLPGLALAISRNGKLVFAKGYGLSRKKPEWIASPEHRFRIAGVSMPLTSLAIMKMAETGVIRLDDRVFGEGALLGKKFGTKPYNEQVKQITVRHLLQHTGGGAVWDNKGDDGSSDPVFSNPELNQAKLIGWVLDNRTVGEAPGRTYSYSNFGYNVLGKIIEEKSGMPYVRYVSRHILRPAGVRTMTIATDTRNKKRKNEVVYYGDNGENPYEVNMKRIEASGGWIASPIDLVRVMVHADGNPEKKDLLSAETIRTMTTGSTANGKYASGWAVDEKSGWWHNGSLPGSYATVVRNNDGFCWAVVTNSRSRKENFGKDFDNLTREIISGVQNWPDHDLFR